MTAVPQPGGFSIVRTIGRYTAYHRGMQFGAAYQPRAIKAVLPAEDMDRLFAQVEPLVAKLAHDRAAHVARADRFLNRAIPAASLAGLVLGWGVSGDILLGLFLAALGAVGAVIVLSGKAMDAPRQATRTAITDVLARDLMGFRVDPAPAISREAIDGFKLFSRIRKVTVDLCLTGARDGRRVVASRIGLMFGYDSNRREKQGDGLTFVMVAVSLPEGAQADGAQAEGAQAEEATRIVPRDRSRVLKLAQKLMHRESAVPTGDAGFDRNYAVSGDVTRLTPALRAGFARLEAEARCDVTGLTEVPAGEGLRPWVVILPDQLVVLTPLTMFDGAFEPPPYWAPLDTGALVPAFASDLAILNGYINAALSLHSGEMT